MMEGFRAGPGVGSVLVTSRSGCSKTYGLYGSDAVRGSGSASGSATLASAFLLFAYSPVFLLYTFPSCLSSLSSPPFLIAPFSTSPIVFILPLPPPLRLFFSDFLLPPLTSLLHLFKNLLLPYFSYSSSSESLFYLPSSPCFQLSSSPNGKTPVKKTVLNTSGWDTQQTLL